MPTHAELSGKLLKDAATFFRTLAEQNEPVRAQMTENATVFEQMSVLIVEDPYGNLEGTPHKELTSRLLTDAAGFFRTLGEQNEAIKDQMTENANVFDQMSQLIMQDPLGILD